MSAGVDKLELLCTSIAELFHQLASDKGVRKWNYRRVLDLRQTDHKLPIIVYCDGVFDGRHKVEVIGVARVGHSRTLKILEEVIDDLSKVRICRIDFCADLPGISVWDMARICCVGPSQNYQIYRNRTGDTVYLQRSKAKTIMLYDKKRRLRAKHDSRIAMLEPDEELTRIEVQLKGAGVPFKKLRHINRYADLDLLAGLKLRHLIPIASHTKPLRAMAAANLADQIEEYGLHAALKRFPSSQRAYMKKLFLEDIDGNDVPDIRGQMRRGIEDWLQDRIRFPRFPEVNSSDDRD